MTKSSAWGLGCEGSWVSTGFFSAIHRGKPPSRIDTLGSDKNASVRLERPKITQTGRSSLGVSKGFKSEGRARGGENGMRVVYDDVGLSRDTQTRCEHVRAFHQSTYQPDQARSTYSKHPRRSPELASLRRKHELVSDLHRRDGLGGKVHYAKGFFHPL